MFSKKNWCGRSISWTWFHGQERIELRVRPTRAIRPRLDELIQARNIFRIPEEICSCHCHLVAKERRCHDTISLSIIKEYLILQDRSVSQRRCTFLRIHGPISLLFFIFFFYFDFIILKKREVKILLVIIFNRV